MSEQCGSTETRSGEPCRFPAPRENCPHHSEEALAAKSRLKKRAADLLRSGEFTRKTVAEKLGISRKTLLRLQRHNEEVARAARTGDEIIVEDVEDAYVKRLKEGEANATELIFFLKNRAPDRWHDRRQIEHSGPEGGPIEVDVDDARERLHRRITRIAGRTGAEAGAVGAHRNGGGSS